MAANSLQPMCLPQGSFAELERLGNKRRHFKRPTGIQGPTSGWVNPDAPVTHNATAADARRWLSATYEGGATGGFEMTARLPDEGTAQPNKDHDYISDDELRGAGMDLSRPPAGAPDSDAETGGAVWLGYSKEAQEKARKINAENAAAFQAAQWRKSRAGKAQMGRMKPIFHSGLVDRAQKNPVDEEPHESGSDMEGGALDIEEELQALRNKVRLLSQKKGPPVGPLKGVTARVSWSDLNNHPKRPRFTEPLAVPEAKPKRKRAPPREDSKTRRRARLVAKLMKEHNISLGEASRHIKGSGLEY